MPTKPIDRKGRAEVAKKAHALEILKIEYVPLDFLRPNSYNPNRQAPQDFELLLRSMREDGFTQPIIVQRATNEIVDGEHRWRAAGELGMVEVPIVYVDMNSEQMKISTLRHNRARGSEDYEAAQQVIRDLRELGALDMAQESLMIDDKELALLLNDASVADALAGEEFSQAWEPRGGHAEQGAVEALDLNEENTPGIRTPVFTGVTPDAADRIAAAEAAIASASSSGERYQLRAARALYRITLTFTGDEALIVKEALGKTPAVGLLEICRRVASAQPV